jgi:hypothetical protein
MKWFLVFAAVLGLGTCSYGFSDYIQVGWSKIVSWGGEQIPIGVEIDRLGLSLQQLDTEITSNGRRVVEESVALDRFAKLVSDKEEGLNAIKSDLSLLKEKYVSTTCDKTKDSLETSMLTRVARFKSQSAAVSTMEKSLQLKREAYEKMREAFEKQKLTRELLQNRLDSLKAEYQSLKMQGTLAQSDLANSAIRKATDLALEIEDRLEVQRRLAEQTEDLLSNDEVETTSENEPAEFTLSDVESVLDNTLDKLAQ